jgi:hypothetical protein
VTIAPSSAPSASSGTRAPRPRALLSAALLALAPRGAIALGAIPLGVIPLAAALAAAPAAAQGAVTGLVGIQLGVSGGVAIPTGDLADGFGNGYRIGAHLGVAPAFIPWGVRFDFAYDRLSGEEIAAPGGAVTLDDATLWSGAVNVVFRVPIASTIRPYLLGGAGAYRIEALGGDADADGEAVTKLGLSGGLGLVLPLGGVNLFAEGKLVHIGDALPGDDGGDDRAARYVPVTVGLSIPLGR